MFAAAASRADDEASTPPAPSQFQGFGDLLSPFLGEEVVPDCVLREFLALVPVANGGVGVSLSLAVANVGVFLDASDSEGDVARVITKLEVILIVPVVVVVVISVVVVSIETLDEALEVEAFDFDLDLGLEKPSASTSLAMVVVTVEGEDEEFLNQTLFPECPSPSPPWLAASTLTSCPGDKSTVRA
jgi:hypothetical protein